MPVRTIGSGAVVARRSRIRSTVAVGLRILAATLVAAFSLQGAPAVAGEQAILPPDVERLAAQRAVVDAAARARYGAPLPGGSADLVVLQRIVDDKVFRADQTYELQCLGIVLGQVLAAHPGLAWVTVQDEFGTDPVLRYKDTSILFFPLTMISKRVDDGREVDVKDMHDWVLRQAEELEAQAK